MFKLYDLNDKNIFHTIILSVIIPLNFVKLYKIFIHFCLPLSTTESLLSSFMCVTASTPSVPSSVSPLGPRFGCR